MSVEHTNQTPRMTVPTTFNMDMELKTKAQLYVTMHNAQLAQRRVKEGKITLSSLLNAALTKRLKNVELT